MKFKFDAYPVIFFWSNDLFFNISEVKKEGIKKLEEINEENTDSHEKKWKLFEMNKIKKMSNRSFQE